MTGIQRRGRRGATITPNWRLEDPRLDPYDLRVAQWLDSHADDYCEDHVGRNTIAARLNMSGDRVSKALTKLQELCVIEVEQGSRGRLVITFDSAMWEDDSVLTGRDTTGRETTGDRSPDDQSGGPIRTTAEEQGEEQARAELDEAFDKFWAKYPKVKNRKTNKAKCRAEFAKIAKRGELDRLRGGYAASLALWRDEREREFAPAPLRYLKQQLWDFDSETTSPERTVRSNMNLPTQPGMVLHPGKGWVHESTLTAEELEVAVTPDPQPVS